MPTQCVVFDAARTESNVADAAQIDHRTRAGFAGPIVVVGCDIEHVDRSRFVATSVARPLPGTSVGGFLALNSA